MTAVVCRKNDRITSVAAGEHVAPRSTAKEDVLSILSTHGAMCDEEIRDAHDLLVARGRMAAKSPQRLRTARAELYDEGRVVEHRRDGRVATAVLPSGYHSTLWVIA